MKKLSTIRKNIMKSANEMYYVIQEHILKSQKKNGVDYLDTQSGTMYYYAYDEDGGIVEGHIKGIRVKDGGIQIMGSPFKNLTFNEEWFAKAAKLYDGEVESEDSEEIDCCWQDILYHDRIIYLYTLLSISDGILEF